MQPFSQQQGIVTHFFNEKKVHTKLKETLKYFGWACNYTWIKIFNARFFWFDTVTTRDMGIASKQADSHKETMIYKSSRFNKPLPHLQLLSNCRSDRGAHCWHGAYWELNKFIYVLKDQHLLPSSIITWWWTGDLIDRIMLKQGKKKICFICTSISYW